MIELTSTRDNRGSTLTFIRVSHPSGVVYDGFTGQALINAL